MYVLLLLQLFFTSLQAQTLTACDSARLNSALDLRDTILHNIVTTDTISYAKSPLPSSFKDVKYTGDGYDSAHGCPRPAADSCLNDSNALVYTVTYPKDHLYNLCPLKAVILMHAGGFAECSTYDQYVIKRMAVQLAQKGFVVYNGEYRRGINPEPANNGIYTSAQQHIAPYRAVQDIRGLFRSIIKRERNKSQFNDYWRIDTTNIFIGGFSAGALAALDVAWYTNSMLDSLYAPPIASGNISYVPGTPDADFYYGEPDLDFHNFYQPKIKAVCSMWGAIPMPAKPYIDTLKQPFFFTNAHLTPAILFHGVQDQTFPFINRFGFSQNVYLSGFPSSAPTYNSVSFCIKNNMGPFTVDATSSTADFVNGSSYNIYKILTYYSKKCEIYVDCTMGHGLDANCGGCSGDLMNLHKNKTCDTCKYGSSFGTTAKDQAETIDYMASRIAVFFQKILHLSQSSFGNTIFVDCENKSHNCGANTNCTNRSCGSQPIIFE